MYICIWHVLKRDTDGIECGEDGDFGIGILIEIICWTYDDAAA